MKKTNNIEFESLIRDEEFIRLIKGNPSEAEQVVAELCHSNPDKEESIRLAVQVLSYYKTEQVDFDNDKIELMWQNIVSKSKAVKPVRRFNFSPYWQIAASVALLLSLTFYLFEHSGNNSIRKFAEKKVEMREEAKIIKSDGSEYLLSFNDSHITYGADGKEIVIEEKNAKNEKLTNQPSESKAVFNQIVVPYGRRHSVTLCDGTVVMLNSGSNLVFPPKFADKKREIFLKGEGYFEVAKDANRPFIIYTEFMNVKVLGTHFNISAYENEKSASAVLVEGSIEVFNNNLFNSNKCKIKPGEGCFLLENSSEFKIQNVDVSEFVSWKDGFFQIRDKPFGTIMKKVEKYYNKTINIDDNELAHRVISGKLVLDLKFEKTLDFLAKTTKSQYKVNEGGNYVFVKKR